jgi:hypothetical protein
MTPMKNVLLIAALTAFALPAIAGGVAEKKKHDAVDAALAESAGKIKDCGKTFKVVFDWKAYDALPFKAPKDKEDHYMSEVSTVGGVGPGVNKLCADKDYKAAMAKIDTIIYKPVGDDKIKVKATVAGATLTFENYTFGSTRDPDEYEKAAKASL